MRTRASALNMVTAWMGQGMALIVQLVTRIIFVRYLSEEYLGLSGLFSNVLAMLSLVELGVGPAMTFSLYKPLAQNNISKIKSLMALYKKIYRIIGVLILLLGLLTVPIYPYLINGKPDIPYLDVIYLFFVFNTGISYFYSYKRSLISSDQKRYVETAVHYSFYVAYNLLQIIVLIFTQNYLLFLLCQVIFTFLENLFLSKIADHMYPYLKEKHTLPLKKEDTITIKRNVGAMIFHKIGTIVVNSTDNILLAGFIGLGVTGLYSNYQLIINAIQGILSQIFKSITASVGNLSSIESEKHITNIFNKTFFAGFWVYGFCTICLQVLVQPFMQLWLGEQYLLDTLTVSLLAISFFLTGMRQAVLTFRDATATYYYDRYKPIFESIINLGASVFLLHKIGISGVFLGTIISSITVCTWVEPYVLYKHILKVPLIEYFKRYIVYTIATIFAGAITSSVTSILPREGIFAFLIKGIICISIPNTTFIVLFYKTEEFQYFKELFMQLVYRKKKSAS